MSSKSRPKKTASTKSATKSSGTLGKAVSVAKAGASMLGIGGGSSKKGGKRSKKRSALWYAKEIQRMKLKRKYIREKFKL